MACSTFTDSDVHINILFSVFDSIRLCSKSKCSPLFIHLIISLVVPFLSIRTKCFLFEFCCFFLLFLSSIGSTRCERELLSKSTTFHSRIDAERVPVKYENGKLVELERRKFCVVSFECMRLSAWWAPTLYVLSATNEEVSELIKKSQETFLSSCSSRRNLIFYFSFFFHLFFCSSRIYFWKQKSINKINWCALVPAHARHDDIRMDRNKKKRRKIKNIVNVTQNQMGCITSSRLDETTKMKMNARERERGSAIKQMRCGFNH